MADKHAFIREKGRETVIQKKMSSSCSAEEFMQYFTGGLVLILGLCLLALDLWTFARKIFFHAHVMDLKRDSTFFSMPAITLCIPSVLLTVWLNYPRRRLFATLVSLQTSATVLLITGYSLGMEYQPKFSNDTLRMGFTIPKQYLNDTLYHLITGYESNAQYQTAVDNIQTKLACCGVYSSQDFSIIPSSCCPKLDCQQNEPYEEGCLRLMQIDIAWHNNITTNITEVSILMYLFNAIMAVAVYVSHYYRWKTRTLNGQTRRKYEE